MATDGPTPPSCNPELFKKGKGFNAGGTAGACAFEELVKEVAAITQKPVDWHYVGGRAIVRYFEEDEAVVLPVIENTLMPKLRQQLAEMYPDIYGAPHASRNP